MNNQEGFAPIVIILIVAGVLVLAGGVYWLKAKAPAGSSLCEKSGGKITNITECDGVTKSQVCTFPNNISCYTENIIGGKCAGSFSPKVLCD